MNPTIRPAQHDDIPALQEIFGQVHEIHVRAHPERFQMVDGPWPDHDYLVGLLDDPTGLFLVAEVDGEVVGFSNVVTYSTAGLPMMVPRRSGKIENLAVRSDMRGKGIGTALMSAVEEWAQSQGFDDLELNVWWFNERARKLYERLGYRILSTRMGKRIRK